MRDISREVVTDAEVRERLKDMLGSAERSDLIGLEDATVAVVAALTHGDADRIAAAGEKVTAVCLPVLEWIIERDR